MIRRRWIWICFSIILATLLGALGTTYNVALVKDYRKMVEFAQNSNLFNLSLPASPKWSVLWGSSGFIAAVFGVVIFLIKVLREMKVNQLQADFIDRVSHELKTPLSTLELTSSLLRDQEQTLSTEDRENLWHSHHEELKRLKRQVEDLLEAARWQSHRMNSDLRVLPFEEWIQKSSSHWKEKLGLNSYFVIDGDSFQFNVLADESKLNLIFENLFENSKKFSLDVPRIHLIKKRDRKKWSISIRDHGRGFHPSQSKKIFSRFYRASHGAPYAIPGSGLGLYLCKSAAETLGWKITASSPGIGQGAEFILSGKIRDEAYDV